MIKTVSGEPLHGVYNIITSKSYAHRAVICCALAGGGTVCRLPDCDDINATISACIALGAEFIRRGDTLICTDGIKPLTKCIDIDCGECAATLRMLMPVAAAFCAGGSISFYGSKALSRRPAGELIDALRAGGVEIISGNTAYKSMDLKLFTLRRRIAPGRYYIDGGVSSQYISGLLFALPTLSGDSDIIPTSPPVSVPYINMTTDALAVAGIEIKRYDGGFHIDGGQAYHAAEFICPTDYSAALPVIVAASCRGDAFIPRLTRADAKNQADAAVIDITKKAGADIEFNDGGMIIKAAGQCNAFDFNAADCPDSVPCMSAFAAACRGKSRIYGIARLKFKESDRVAAILSMLTAFGCHAEYNDADGGTLYIDGGILGGGPIDFCSSDHRILMAAAVMAKISGRKLSLDGASFITKSYPAFFEIFK